MFSQHFTLVVLGGLPGSALMGNVCVLVLRMWYDSCWHCLLANSLQYFSCCVLSLKVGRFCFMKFAYCVCGLNPHLVRCFGRCVLRNVSFGLEASTTTRSISNNSMCIVITC